jgi:hypothetical protein
VHVCMCVCWVSVPIRQQLQAGCAGPWRLGQEQRKKHWLLRRSPHHVKVQTADIADPAGNVQEAKGGDLRQEP